jgi:hypothetical protein
MTCSGRGNMRVLRYVSGTGTMQLRIVPNIVAEFEEYETQRHFSNTE